MKTLLSILGIIMLTAVLTSCGESETPNSEETSNSEESSKVKTIKIGNLEVMTEDLGKMTWDDAKKACTDLGDGWILPTYEELKILFENKDKIGGFANSSYWSSSDGSKNDNASMLDFNDAGERGLLFGGRDYGHYVRAVRSK